jgi:hypothetical protein
MREMGPNRAERVDRNHLDETEGLGIVITMRAVLPEVARRFHKGHEICKQALGLEQDSASLIDGNRSFEPPRPATCCAQHNAGLRLAGRLSTKPAPGAHRGGIGAACQRRRYARYNAIMREFEVCVMCFTLATSRRAIRRLRHLARLSG